MNRINKILGAFALTITAIGTISCSDTKSYAELLTEENQAINGYLLNQKVELSLPANNSFVTGPDAPFYRLDEEGSVYMKVVSGNFDSMAEADEQVYFRFERRSLLDYNPNTNTFSVEPWGNLNDLSLGSSSFRFGNYTLSSSSQWGSGLQLPLNYIGLGSEVYLIIKSQFGLSSEIANVTPFLYHVVYQARTTGADDASL